MTLHIDHNANLPTQYLPDAEQLVVKVGEKTLRVLRYSHFDVPLYFVHASLGEGTHNLTLTIKRKYTHLSVHSCYPERVRLLEDLGKSLKKSVEMSVEGDTSVVIDCDGLGYVFLSFDPLQSSPSGRGVLSAIEAKLMSDCETMQTESLRKALKRISDDENLHTLVLPAGLYRSGDLNLPSGVRLHLESGAVLLASDNPEDIGDGTKPGWAAEREVFISAKGATDISITGHGHIDGNRRHLDPAGYHKGMAVFTDCRNLHIEGVVLSDPCGWNCTPRRCDGVEVRRVKILNNRPLWSCINTDGINPDGCRDVLIEDVMMHTGDDAVAIKSTDYNGEAREVDNITVRRLLTVNNSATAKVGTETRARSMRNIRFENIVAVQTARLCVIDSFDEARIENITFENCRVHRLHRWPNEKKRVVHLNTPAESFRPIHGGGCIENIFLQDIISEDDGPITLEGCSQERGVFGVQWGNVKVAGRVITWSDLKTGPHISGSQIPS